MSQTRRHFTAEQKAQIVRRHLSGKEPVSDLADEFGLQPIDAAARSLVRGTLSNDNER